jgi:hypothetical protein
VSITLTAAQAETLARIAAGHAAPLQLHQVGEDPDLFVTTVGPGEPDLRISPDGAEERLHTARDRSRS